MSANDKTKGPVNLYAKLLDISPEGMRFFERKGLVYPQRDENTGYRLYGSEDGNLLISCKKYRQYGFSVSEVAHLVRESSVDSLITQLKKQHSILEQELLEKERIIYAVEHKIQQLSALKEQEGTFCIQTLPLLYWVPARRNGSILDSKEEIEYTRKCNSCQPYTEVGIRMTKNGDIETGHVITEEHALRLGFEKTIKMPESKCLFTTLSTDEPLGIHQFTIFDGVFKAAKKHGYVPHGDALAINILTSSPSPNVYKYVYQIYIPIV